MSTLSQPHLEPSWKQEVNRRLAAHKSRKGSTPAEDAVEQAQTPAATRAAETAARVAARYAKAPTYSQMQAEEARVAVRAAQIATQVALEAQAVAETALAEMHAATAGPSFRKPATVETIARPARREESSQPQRAERAAEPAGPHALVQEVAALPAALSSALPDSATEPFFAHQLPEGQSYAIRWEPDMPAAPQNRKPASPRQEQFELPAEDWWTPAQVNATLRNEPMHVEAQPAHANLIEFPRELVATRKLRPRLPDAPVAVTDTEGQLSIFEVHPQSVSSAVETLEAFEDAHARSWTPAEWSRIELDPLPAPQRLNHAETTRAADRPVLAPLGLRLMATVVDCGLIFAVFFFAVLMVASKMSTLPGAKSAEVAGMALLLLTGLVYHAFFYSLTISTPGMKYAGIALCTFDNESPTRDQLRRRLGAMLVSLLPMGIGLVWSVFDEDHLSWHDRMSQTYLRKR